MKTNTNTSLSLRKTVTKTALTGLVLMASASASAVVQVAAFSDGRGFESLMTGDLEQATKAFPGSNSRRLSYADTNNLCVLQILQAQEAVAIQTCARALSKARAITMKRNDRLNIKAEIYTNLSAAQMLSGRYIEAQESLSKALQLNKSTTETATNATHNQLALRSKQLAAN